MTTSFSGPTEAQKDLDLRKNSITIPGSGVVFLKNTTVFFNSNYLGVATFIN